MKAGFFITMLFNWNVTLVSTCQDELQRQTEKALSLF